MRKSTREIKKTELFQFEQRLTKLPETDDDDHNSSPETDEEENFFDEKPRGVSKSRVAKISRSLKRNANEALSSSLYETVRNSKKLSSEVEKWIENYKEDRITATVDLVNFILMSAGAKKQWIPSDVDLDALEPEELDELLSEMITDMTNSEGSKMYPLQVATKQFRGPSFRDRYQSFWTILAEKIQSSEDQFVASKEGIAMLKIITDQLVSLSSMAVVNVRDAVTEASLIIGQRAVACCVGLRARCDATRRQLQAETNKRTPTHNSQRTPKYLAILKQSTRLDEALAAMEELCSTVFNSVFVHRFKDSQETVRALCTRHIGDWLPLDPVRLYKDDYLKYIGWMCFDYSAAVRREAVLSVGKLLKSEAYAGVLSGFVERFIGRFVEIAVGDVDDGVALEMMTVMRDLQLKGMLDQVDEESLDLVDEVIFDGGASKRVRQEALAFMMDHTEGFEDEEEDDNGSVSGLPKKGKAVKKGEIDETRALARKQKIAMQLETLSEFAEHHLCGEQSRCYLVGESTAGCKVPDLSRIEMLVEVCLELPQSGIMRDWSTMISLLLRESDELISTALRPTLSSILLRIFVASALKLRDWYVQVKAAQNDEVDGMKGGKQRRGSFANRLDSVDQQKALQLESLNEHLLRDLPTLLTRFRDDPANLSVLVSLLGCCDVTVSNKALKSLLKSVADFFSLSSDENVICSLCTSLRGWTMAGGTSKGVIDASVSSLLSGLWTAIEGHLQTLKGASVSLTALAAEMALGGSKGTKKPSRRSSADERANIEEAVLSASACVMKYKNLWMLMDCRKVSDIGCDDIADQFVELADIAVSLCDDQGYSGELGRACASIASDSAHVVQGVLMWYTHDLYTKARNLSEQDPDADDAEDEDVPDNEGEADLASSADTVMSLREKLVDVLQGWMALGDQDGDSQGSDTGSDSPFHSTDGMYRSLQREAFSMIGTLRTLYPVRQNQYKHVGVLAFTPSQDILAGLRKVFEQEGGRIKSRIKQCTELIARGESGGTSQSHKQATAEVEQLTEMLVKSLLQPLSNSMMFDVENLNRRQAAAVLCYYIDTSSVVQDSVKGLIKCLKDSDIVKYLEVQMVALKSSYTEHVLSRLIAKQQMEEGSALVDYLAAERVASDEIHAGYSHCILLAKKLVVTMGVGKAKGVALLATVNFFKAGIDVCLTQSGYMGFVRLLELYLRLLPPVNMEVVREYFESKVESTEDIAAALEGDDANGDRELEALIDFRDQLAGKARRRRESGGGDSEVSSQGSPSRQLVAGRARIAAAAKGTRTSLTKSQSRKKTQAKRGKRQPSILESVHEDDGEDEEEEGEDEDIPVRRTSIEKKVLSKSKAASIPPPQGSRRSSRGEAVKAISYSDGRDDDEEEEGEGDEEEEENNDDSHSAQPEPTVLARSRSKVSQKSKAADRHDTSDEAPDDDNNDGDNDGDVAASPSPPLQVNDKAKVGRKAALPLRATYSDSEDAPTGDDLILGQSSRSGSRRDNNGTSKGELEDSREVQQNSSRNKRNSNGSSSSSSSSSSSGGQVRTDAVHLGLALEETVDWIGSREEQEEEEEQAMRSSAMHDSEKEEDFYKDTNYSRKRGSEQINEKTKKPKIAPIVAVPTRTSSRVQSSQSQSSEESFSAAKPKVAAGKKSKNLDQIRESVPDPVPVEELDIFEGLNVPNRKRYR